MTINLIDPTTFTSSVFIADTVTSSGGTPQTIPPFPTKLVGTDEVPVSAALVVQSTEGGILNPILTDAEINALPAPIAGLQAYNSTTNSLDVYTGAAWASLATTGGGGNTYGPGNPLYLYENTVATSIGVSPTPYTGNFDTIPSGNYLFTNLTTQNFAGQNNLIIGQGAGASSTTASGNILFGTNAGNSIVNSASVVAIGTNAFQNSTGHQSVAIGDSSLSNIEDTFTGTSIGFQSLMNNSTGNQNTAIGWKAGILNTVGNLNVFIGDTCAVNQLIYNNAVIIGWTADAYVPVGGDPIANPNLTQYITVVGQASTAAGGGTAIGAGCHAQGSDSIAIGVANAITYGPGCIAIGPGSIGGFSTDITVSRAIALGGDSVAYGPACLALGNGSIAGDNADSTVSNSVAIGADSICVTSNSINLGANCVVGINNPTPVWALDIGVVNNGTPTNVTGIQLALTDGNAPPIPVTTGGAIFIGIDGNLYFQSSNIGIGTGGLFRLSATPA